jgi:hypothetical protein
MGVNLFINRKRLVFVKIPTIQFGLQSPPPEREEKREGGGGGGFRKRTLPPTLG